MKLRLYCLVENYDGAMTREAGFRVFPYREMAVLAKELPPDEADLSNAPQERILRSLQRHQLVIEEIMRKHDVLPFKFETSLDDTERVDTIIRDNYSRFRRMFDGMRGKLQIEVIALWSSMDAVFEEIASIGEIRQLREAVSRMAGSESLKERIRVGQMVKAELENKREYDAGRLLEPLKPHVVDFRLLDIRDDSMIFNAAFLIRRALLSHFQREVVELDGRHAGNINFRCIGPLPPYSFAALRIKHVETEALNEARCILGLGETMSLQEIKEVYREMASKGHPDRPGQDGRHFEKITEAYRVLTRFVQNYPVSLRPEDIDGRYVLET